MEMEQIKKSADMSTMQSLGHALQYSDTVCPLIKRDPDMKAGEGGGGPDHVAGGERSFSVSFIGWGSMTSSYYEPHEMQGWEIN